MVDFLYDSTLKSNATATTNPDPSTLGTPNPYDGLTPTEDEDRFIVASAWTTQSSTNCKALISVNTRDYSADHADIELAFEPSGGAAVTYTLTVWQWSTLGACWVKPYDNPSLSFTGNQKTTIERPGVAPWFIQVNTISAGSLGIYFSSKSARAI